MGPGMQEPSGQEEEVTAGWVGTVVCLDARRDLLTAGFLVCVVTLGQEVDLHRGIHVAAVTQGVGPQAVGWNWAKQDNRR